MNDYSTYYPSHQNSCIFQPSSSFNRSFHSKIVGVTFNGRQRFIPGLRTGEELQVKRETWNHYDKNAIAVYDGRGNQLGYISKELASDLAPKMDDGVQYRITVSSVTGGNNYSYGVNILISSMS